MLTGIPQDDPLSYELVRSARRTLAIQIRQDGHVVVRAPMRLPRIEIERFVASRADWIARHLAEIEARPVAPDWGEGRCWWHFGVPMPVLFSDRLPARQRVLLADDGLRVHARCQAAGEAAVTDALAAWQQREAALRLPERLAAQVARLGEDWRPVDLRLRRMRSRWGSCSRDGRVTLNTALLHAAPACIDYVICHELAHLREFNHGPRFHALMDGFCPDWPETKRLLEQQASLWGLGLATL